MNERCHRYHPAWGLCIGLAGACLLVVGGTGLCAAEPPDGRAKRILVLFSDERMLPAGMIVDRVLRETLEEALDGRVEIHDEYLDRTRFSGEQFKARQSDFLREKYAEREPDVIIAGGSAALTFLLEFRNSLFPGTPVVHCAIPDRLLPKPMPDEAIVGIPLYELFAGSLELALQVNPDIRRVAVVSGTSERDQHFIETFRQSIPRFEHQVTLEWLTNRSIEEVSEAVSRLPSDSVVLYLGMFEDARGRVFVPLRALQIFAPFSAVPIYGAYATYLGHGIVGGEMVTFEEIGREAGLTAARILSGIKPRDAVDWEANQPQPMFDWREVRRWGLDESRFPTDSIVLFQEPTFWETHGKVILIIGSICLLEAALIAVLIWQFHRQRKAEAQIRENEQRMNLAMESANFGIWIRDLTTDEIWATSKWRELFGFGPDEMLDFEKVIHRIPAEERTEVINAMAGAEAECGSYSIEFCLRLPEGPRWLEAKGRYTSDATGRAIRAMGVCRDVTPQKLAEATTRDLGGRLIHAQEEAQIRLARELHDDLSQRLALLAVELDMCGQSLALSESGFSSRMAGFSSQAQAIGSDLHRLAHHLHPAKLDQLGLEAALDSFCREFAKVHQLQIRFSSHKVPQSLSDEVTLCLYRVGQEALQNVIKHSGAKNALVTLTGREGEVELIIQDDGVGFNPTSRMGSGSLGLVGMEERVRFVGGHFVIRSRPNAGTRVEARVPLPPVQNRSGDSSMPPPATQEEALVL